MDFGRYRFRARFKNTLYSWWDADYENLNGEFLNPDAPAYQQPLHRNNLGGFAGHDAYRTLMATVIAYERGEANRNALSAALYGAVAAAGTVIRGKAPNDPGGAFRGGGLQSAP